MFSNPTGCREERRNEVYSEAQNQSYSVIARATIYAQSLRYLKCFNETKQIEDRTTLCMQIHVSIRKRRTNECIL